MAFNYYRKLISFSTKTNWTVWPLAQYINFAYIPTEQRVLYVTVLGLVWNSYLSHMGNRHAEVKKEE